MYSEQIKSASIIKNYRRKTNLDIPDECKNDFDIINDIIIVGENKLDKEELIDDFEIKS